MTPPTPYSEDFYNNLNGRIAYIETSRGCPYRCAFCLSGRCSKLRFFELEQVKKDIINLSLSGTKTIKFVDRTFNADSKRANEIIKFILENRGSHIPENICFHFEIAGDILTEETFELLENAPEGLFQLEIGMQSFNEDTLQKINRKTNTEKLIKNIKKLLEMGNMHIHIDLIVGLTGEDIKSFENSFNIGYVGAGFALEGKNGVMAAFERNKGGVFSVKAVDISQSANAEKIVPPEFISPDGTDVTQAFIDYAYPLIQGEAEVTYKNGIPQVLVRG